MAEDKNIANYFLYLQTNLYPEAKEALFSYTGLSLSAPYFCCQTGVGDFIYKNRLSFSGQTYEALFNLSFQEAIRGLLDKYHAKGICYLLGHTHKEIAVIFQPCKGGASALAIAEEIDRLIQTLYDAHLPLKTSRYCSTTALSGPMSGINGIQEGCAQTEHLKRLSFFRMTPGVLTQERLMHLQKNIPYMHIMLLCREMCNTLSRGDGARCMAQAEHLFLQTLKYTFSFELLRDVLSYLKHYLSTRITVYGLVPIPDLNRLCSIDSYITIEECFEALRPIMIQLAGRIHENGSWKDSVVNAAYYLLDHLSEDVSLDDIASFADTTPTYLSNQFHQQTGMTIKQYQQKIRMERACRLLESTDDKIADIAVKTGFFDRRYFTKTFKDTYGLTPAQYRESLHDKTP